jgi:LacI family transcriptional regulator
MDAARECGLRIPDDISIIGFDDVPQASFVYPRLTTVRQPLEQMGRVAARMLLERIEDRSRPPQRITLPTQLVIRDSCAPYRSQGSDQRKTLKKTGGSLLRTT